MKSEHYGPLLIPIILERLPDDIKLQISRSFGNESWVIEDFMKILRLEIAARESCCIMKEQASTDDKGAHHMTTSALMTGTKQLICAFCAKNFFHNKCQVVTDINARKDIARKNRLLLQVFVQRSRYPKLPLP